MTLKCYRPSSSEIDIVTRAHIRSEASHSLAATFHFDDDRLALHLMINAYWEALTFAIPALDNRYSSWRRCVDTFSPPPADLRGWSDSETVDDGTVVVQPRSIVVLVTKFD